MADAIASGAVAATWLAWCFVLLQFATTGRRIPTTIMLVSIAVGIAVLASRVGSNVGFEWLRGQRLRSDAFALGALVPVLSLALGTWMVDRRGTIQGSLPLLLGSLACGAAGIAALAIGRSGWYWEFVAVVVAGVLLAATGALGAVRGSSSANVRIVLGSFAAFGGFLTVGGTLMLLAWQATA